MNGFFRAINNNCFTNKPFITFGMLAGGHNHIKKYERYYDNNLKKKDKLEHSDIIKKNIMVICMLCTKTMESFLDRCSIYFYIQFYLIQKKKRFIMREPRA